MAPHMPSLSKTVLWNAHGCLVSPLILAHRTLLTLSFPMSAGKIQQACLGLSILNHLCASQVISSCCGKALNEEIVLGPDEAQHVGEEREKWGEDSKGQLQCLPVFMCLFNKDNSI